MITIKRTFCPGRGMIRPEELTGYVFSPEAAAHTFIITKMEKVDGQEAAVPFDAGTDISCRFIKANGVTELVDGDLTDDGAASITLPAECYQVPGRFILSIYAETSEETICIYSATATALAGDTEEINVSGNTKRTIDAQIAALNDAVENAQETVEQVQEVIDSIPQDYTALSDSVSDLKSHLERDTKLLYAKQITPTYSQGLINNNNGGETNTETALAQYIRTNKLRCANGLQITVAEGYKARVAIYTSQGGVQGFIGWLDSAEWNGTHYYQGPDAYYYRLRLRKDPISNDITTNDGLNNVTITIYRTDETLTIPLAPADGKAVGEKIRALESVTYGKPYGIQSYQMSLFEPTANLFAGAFSNYKHHRYYDNGTDGKMSIKVTSNYDGWLIRVKPNTTYTLGPLDYRIKQFNTDLDMIKSITDVSNSEPNTITTEANAYWMSVTQLDDRDMSGWMMVEGNAYPEEYVSGYPQWVNTPKSAGVGKRIAFFGDSITAGSGVTGQPDSQIYHQYLHDIYGFTCLNYAYGGSGYVTTYESQGDTPGAIENDSSLKGLHGKGLPGRGYGNKYYHFWPNNVLSMMQRMSDQNSIDDLEKITDPTTLDGVVIFAGTNDWSHEVSLVNFGNGVDAVFDYYQNNFGSVPLLVMTPIHRINDTTSGAAHLSEYADIVIQKCREHGIPYIDTLSMSGLQPNNASNRAVFFPRDDGGNDGVHPNHFAHRRIERAIGETLNQLMLWKNTNAR